MNQRLKGVRISLISTATVHPAVQTERAENAGQHLRELHGVPDLSVTSGVGNTDRITDLMLGSASANVFRVRNSALYRPDDHAARAELDRLFDIFGQSKLTAYLCSDTGIMDEFAERAAVVVLGNIIQRGASNCWVTGHTVLQNVVAMKLLSHFLDRRRREAAIQLLLSAKPTKECGWFHIGRNDFDYDIE